MLGSQKLKELIILKNIRRLNRIQKVKFLSTYLNPKQGIGLEIGPDITPVFSKNDGFSVEYIETGNTEQIRKRAENAGKDPQKVSEIDYVFSRNASLAENTGKRNYFNYVVSSHVIEHIPDFVSHLMEVSDVLMENGVYGIIIPDKNLTTDFLRPSSSLGDVVEAFLQKRRHPPISRYIDANRYRVVDANTNRGWWNTDSLPDLRVDNLNYKSKLKQAIESGQTHVPDNWFGHTWVFSPDSFLSIFYDLKEIGLITYKLIDIYPTGHMDFIVILAKPASSFEDLDYDSAMKNLKKIGYIESWDNMLIN